MKALPIPKLAGILLLALSAVNSIHACELANEAIAFPVDPKEPFFPDKKDLKCRDLGDGLVVNLPLRVTGGELIYVLGKAPLNKLNAYLISKGTPARAKANAGDPNTGTVRIALYDMPTSAGPFRSLATTIVADGGDAYPAALYYANYFANEDYNQKIGLKLTGVDKVKLGISTNLREVLGGKNAPLVITAGSSGGKDSVFQLNLTLPELTYTYVKSLNYLSYTGGINGGISGLSYPGQIRGNFSAPITVKDFKLQTSGALKQFLDSIGFQFSGFQVVKDFDLVERLSE